MKQTLFFVFALIFFQACSSKQYFEAKNTTNIKTNIIKTPAYIKTVNSVGATLDDNRYLDKNGISKTKLKKGFYFINNSNSNIISANKNYEVNINNNINLKFKSNVIAASLKDDLLALIFSNNVIAIYDIQKKQYKLKKYLEISHINDYRVAMPIFLNSIILFPTLDGKIIVIDKNTFEVNKTITVDTSDEVKNIILLKDMKDHLIVASSNTIASISSESFIKKDFFIQSITSNDKYIFIASLDGKIIKLDKELNILKSKKYKFAKFQAISISNKHIFAIESQGYIVKLSMDFKNESIDKISFENDEKTFSSDSKIYYEDKLLRF